MNIAQLNLIAVVGRAGLIGNVGEQPMFPTQESAMAFREKFVALVAGGVVILGGRTYQMLLDNGFRPEAMPFRHYVWDRQSQSIHSPGDVVEMLSEQGDPVFVAGGRYTYECFMPWVEQLFITKAALTIGSDPVYMPELFGRLQ
jgi:dihydrofolate reductase